MNRLKPDLPSPPESSSPLPLTGRRVLYAVSTMGLGHVQRTLPVLQALRARGASLTVVAHGRALEVLRRELAHDLSIRFEDVPDYPPLQRGRGIAHYIYYFIDLARLRARAADETRALEALHRETPFDLLIGDGRFGWVIPGVPCLLLIHQVKVLLPRGLRAFQWLSDWVQRKILSRYTHLLILDLEDPVCTLAGQLAHNRILRGLPHTYIGPLSTVGPEVHLEAEAAAAPVDSDLLFVMGGFIEAERSAFVAWIREALARHPGLRVTLLLGGGVWASGALPAGATVIPMALGPTRLRAFRGTRLLVGRTGHTTLMDLRAMGGRALLFPTPGMTEHIELARMVRGWRHQILDPEARALAESLESLASLTLPPHLRPVRLDAAELPPPLRSWSTPQSVARALQVVDRVLP